MGCFVGIDVGKGKHDYAVVNEDGGLLKTGEFTGNKAGFAKLIKVLIEFDIQLVGMEATGHYWRNLWQGLLDYDYTCTLLNPSATVTFDA
ncbi:MAG: transposase [Mariprofundaceae bacterium]